MNQNVGDTDRTIRSIVGPALIALGYARLGGSHGHPIGLLSMMAGVALAESAITRVCPLNYMLGIDTYSNPETEALESMSAHFDQAGVPKEASVH